jgi:hypothetical protein
MYNLVHVKNLSHGTFDVFRLSVMNYVKPRTQRGSTLFAEDELRADSPRNWRYDM